MNIFIYKHRFRSVRPTCVRVHIWGGDSERFSRGACAHSPISGVAQSYVYVFVQTYTREENADRAGQEGGRGASRTAPR